MKKLRGLLQERSDELRDKNLQALAHMREVKVRQQELQHTVSQLQQSRFEITDLHSQLEHERKKVKTLEEGSKKVLLCHFFVFFSSLPGGGSSESVCATFGEVLMYTEPQKKSETKILFFRGEI